METINKNIIKIFCITILVFILFGCANNNDNIPIDVHDSTTENCESIKNTGVVETSFIETTTNNITSETEKITTEETTYFEDSTITDAPTTTNKPKETKPNNTTKIKETEPELTTTEITEPGETKPTTTEPIITEPPLIEYEDIVQVHLVGDVNVWSIVPLNRQWASIFNLDYDAKSIEVEVCIDDKCYKSNYNVNDIWSWCIWFGGNPFPKQYYVIPGGYTAPKIVLQDAECYAVCNNIKCRFIVSKYTNPGGVALSGALSDGNVYDRYGQWDIGTFDCYEIENDNVIPMNFILGKDTFTLTLPENMTWLDLCGLNSEDNLKLRNEEKQRCEYVGLEYHENLRITICGILAQNVGYPCSYNDWSGMTSFNIACLTEIYFDDNEYYGNADGNFNENFLIYFYKLNPSLKYNILYNHYLTEINDPDHIYIKNSLCIDYEFFYGSCSITKRCVYVVPSPLFVDNTFVSINLVDQSQSGTIYDEMAKNRIWS